VLGLVLPWTPGRSIWSSFCATARLRVVRVLALYDIHGNVDALDAVLADAPAFDLVIVGGDAVPGPFCTETLDRLARLPARWVRGNGEREVAEAIEGVEPAEGDVAAITAKLTLQEIGAERARQLGELPLTDRIDGVLYCHATPRDDNEILTRISSGARYAAALEGAGALVVAGHTHQQHDVQIGATRFINAGSVGLPYEGDGAARWLFVEDGVPELRSTVYDAKRAGERMKQQWPDARSIDAALVDPVAAEEITEIFESRARSGT
jgi:predicted phosphodiesterase